MSAQTFIGRDEDCDVLAGLLEEGRLVTLVGPGGVGKTRLATELGSRIEDRFPGGLLVVELSGTTDDEDIESVAARQLDVESVEALLLRSVDADTLILLDNCESALDQARDLARKLLDGGTAIRVLATSRSPLRAPDERVFHLEPLAVPSEGDLDIALSSDAVRLFLDRASAAGARWAADRATHGEDAVRLVRKLNGLPLAIELAAARARVLSPKELDGLLDEQLDVLRRPGGEGGRHHSLRSVIAASYDPLSDAEKRFFRHLAVLSAPFPLELAHKVAGDDDASTTDTLDELTTLVDASLVDARLDAEGRSEYRLLDSIRAFGLERMDEAGESQAAHERFADAMATVADELVTAALESFTPEVLGGIRDRFVHLAAAMSWCIENDPSPARTYRMFIPLYGPTGARTEVAELARRVRDAWSQSEGPQAEALAVMGTATFLNGDYEAGAALSSRGLEHPSGTSLAKLMACRTLGFMASLRGEAETAKKHLDRAIEFATPFSASFARELRVSRACVVVDPAESPDALEELYDVGREAAKHDEIVTIVWAASVSAYHRLLLEDVSGARRAAESAVAVADRSGLHWTIGTAHRTMASVLAMEADWNAARDHFLRAFNCTVAIGDVEGTAMVLRAAAGAALHLGEEELAHQLWATIPPVRGLPVIRSIFHELEEKLLRELGAPTPLDSATLTRTARSLLGASESPVDTSHGATPEARTAPASAEARVIRFEDCELDLSMQELRRDGERVHVEPQVFDVLAYLVARRGTVVSTDELMNEVWSDRFVSLSAVSSRIAAARRATGDDGQAQRIIRTVRGKGFSFVADLQD